MSEQIVEQEELLNEAQEAPVTEETVSEEIVSEITETADTPAASKLQSIIQLVKDYVQKLSKKQIAIIGAAAVAIIAIIIVLCVPSKFESVKNECVHIAGQITGSGDYFMIDTLPDTYENMSDAMKALLLPRAQENALEAIKYANEELGFNGSIYSQMMKTTALMGRQSSENDKYRVSWTYHPDDGLEVTYEKK